MGARLPPGEAERRAAERRRATWSGERYQRYDPATEGGYGSFKSWADAAAAFIHGDPADFAWIGEPEEVAKPATGPRRQIDARLVLLGLDEMPADLKTLTSAYRKAVMAAFRANGSKDTDPEYVDAFMKVTKAFDGLKTQRRWG